MSNYCKKSSIDSVASAIKNISNDTNLMNFPDDFKLKIHNLDVVENKPNPSILLHKTNTSYTIPKGRYEGGTISVVPNERIITPKTTDQQITSANNTALKKVAVLPIPASLSGYKLIWGRYDLGLNSSSSWSLNLDFEPEGAVIIGNDTSLGSTAYVVGVAHEQPGGHYGATKGTAPGGYLNNGIILNKSQKKVLITANFYGENIYVIWGH